MKSKLAECHLSGNSQTDTSDCPFGGLDKPAKQSPNFTPARQSRLSLANIGVLLIQAEEAWQKEESLGSQYIQLEPLWVKLSEVMIPIEEKIQASQGQSWSSRSLSAETYQVKIGFFFSAFASLQFYSIGTSHWSTHFMLGMECISKGGTSGF